MEEENQTQQVRVGLGVVVVKNGRALMGKRLGNHGPQTWSCPGGHLEYRESFDECARREVMEETGLEVGELTQLITTNDYFPESGKHYVTVYYKAEWVSGEPEVKEPDRCEGWEWFSWDSLPSPLFIPFQNFVKTGIDPTALTS